MNRRALHRLSKRISHDQTRILAKQIKGSKFVEMKGLGHFPMAENFAVFKSYLMPILDEISMNGER